MSVGLAAGQPVWLVHAEGRARGRVVQSYYPASGGHRVIIRATEDGGPYRRGQLIVTAAVHIRRRSVDHRAPRQPWYRRLMKGTSPWPDA